MYSTENRRDRRVQLSIVLRAKKFGGEGQTNDFSKNYRLTCSNFSSFHWFLFNLLCPFAGNRARSTHLNWFWRIIYAVANIEVSILKTNSSLHFRHPRYRYLQCQWKMLIICSVQHNSEFNVNIAFNLNIQFNLNVGI